MNKILFLIISSTIIISANVYPKNSYKIYTEIYQTDVLLLKASTLTTTDSSNLISQGGLCDFKFKLIKKDKGVLIDSDIKTYKNHIYPKVLLTFDKWNEIIRNGIKWKVMVTKANHP